MTPDPYLYATGAPPGVDKSPRQEFFPFRGGPCDGTDMPVEVDDNGVPVELRTVLDITTPDASINSARGFQSMQISSLYERCEELGPDGFRYYFDYRGQEVIDLNGR
jgi:hypothetical protein